jgi:hypothetical protein
MAAGTATPRQSPDSTGQPTDSFTAQACHGHPRSHTRRHHGGCDCGRTP